MLHLLRSYFSKPLGYSRGDDLQNAAPRRMFPACDVRQGTRDTLYTTPNDTVEVDEDLILEQSSFRKLIFVYGPTQYNGSMFAGFEATRRHAVSHD